MSDLLKIQKNSERTRNGKFVADLGTQKAGKNSERGGVEAILGKAARSTMEWKDKYSTYVVTGGEEREHNEVSCATLRGSGGGRPL